MAKDRRRQRTIKHFWFGINGKSKEICAQCTKCKLIREISSAYVSKTEYMKATTKYFKDGIEFMENQKCE